MALRQQLQAEQRQTAKLSGQVSSAVACEGRLAACSAAKAAAASAAAPSPAPPATAPGQVAVGSTTPPDSAWMCIAIPTVHRAGQDYLNPTLGAILSQLPTDSSHPLYHAVRIVVVDNSRTPQQHTAFEAAAASLAGPQHPHAGYVAFASNPLPRATGHGGVQQGRGDPNAAGPTVQQQSRDVIWTLHAAVTLCGGGGVGDIPPAPPGSHPAPPADVGAVQGVPFPRPVLASTVMLMEDDFRLCPNALLALLHMHLKAASMPHHAALSPQQAAVRLDKAGVPRPPPLQPDAQGAVPWLVLRVCYGLNGVVLHTRDVPEFAWYLSTRLTQRPPDHLLVEWFAGEKPDSAAFVGQRAHFTYKYNLLDHFGRQSSLRAAPQGTFGACFDPLDTGNLFPVEAWDARTCGHDDMTPCRPADDPARVPALDLKAGATAANVPLRIGDQHKDMKGHLRAG